MSAAKFMYAHSYNKAVMNMVQEMISIGFAKKFSFECGAETGQ